MRLLVIRTSAMGDVALTLPVIRAMREQYPGVELVMLTRPAFKPFFFSVEDLRLFYPDFKKRHNGLPGLFRLFREIRSCGRMDAVIDLHDVLRSRVLRILFRLTGVPSHVIDKGRKEKKAVIRGKIRYRLRHSAERYSDTFARAGFPLVLKEGPWIIPSPDALSEISALTATGGVLNIGVAPFAKHRLKIWPEEFMIRLLELIAAKYPVKIFLFGGMEESERLASLQTRIKGSFNTLGLPDLDKELALMSRLDLMIAMDSSNMHMAALCGTKTISIWGATDPVAGFGAWMQPEEFSVRIPVEELTCRPCTVFGKGECRRGDFACMNWLTPESVLKRIDKIVLSGLAK
jgi:ADP-heptose:LPS heptosyltransferase